jgi:beta-lactamase regulating signal transducer with metallopeptidase domain
VAVLFLDVALRATLIAAGTACVLWALRVRTAGERHAAWTAVLVYMLLLPIYSLAGPKLPFAVVPGNATSSEFDAGASPEARKVGAGLSLARLALFADTAPLDRSGLSRGIWVLIGVYCLGACALLARLAIGTVHARRLYRSTVIRAGRATSVRCATPITVGWLSPVLILPDGWERWSAGHLDAVLTHEQEHLRRRDPLIQWFALLNRAILWFHPLAWWLARRLSTLAEEACDAAVLRAGHSPQDYSDYLLDMAHAVSRQGRRLNVAGMAMPGGGLPDRIRRILEEESMTPRSRTRALCTLAFCATSSIICTAVTLAPRPSAIARSHVTGGAHAAPGVSLATPPTHAVQTRSATNAPVLDIATRPRPGSSTSVRGGPSQVTQPNFSGDWLLVGSTFMGSGRSSGDGRMVSIVSGAPVNCGRECTIVQSTGSLTILRTATTQDAAPPDDGTVVLNLEGGESTIAQAADPLAEYKAAAAWDGDTLVVTRSITQSLLVTQSLSLEENTLRVVNTFNIPNSAPVTLTYMRR